MTENKQAPGDSGTSRRNFIKAAGVTAAAAAATTGFTAGTAAAATTRSRPSGQSDPELVLSVDDYIDRCYVLSAATPALALRMPNGTSPIRLRDGLRIEVTSGHAEIREDRYTGAILLKPARGEAVEARAIAPAGTVAASLANVASDRSAGSAVISVGYDASDIPKPQAKTMSTGGGACVSTASGDLSHLTSAMAGHLSTERRRQLESALPDRFEATLRVRAAIMGNVIPTTPTERKIVWQHARYYGIEKLLGVLRFTYNTAHRSVLSMTGHGTSFFPADGTNSIYCWLEMLDLGLAGGTRDPMILPSKDITWPPYSTPMRLSRPVTFYDDTDPDRQLLTVTKNTMELYDYNGSIIKCTNFRVDASGTLHAVYRVTNQSTSQFTGRWMLIGDHADTNFASTDAELHLGPAGSSTATKEIEVRAPVHKSELTQTVAFAIMSLSNPLVLGITGNEFKYPDA